MDLLSQSMKLQKIRTKLNIGFDNKNIFLLYNLTDNHHIEK